MRRRRRIGGTVVTAGPPRLGLASFAVLTKRFDDQALERTIDRSRMA